MSPRNPKVQIETVYVAMFENWPEPRRVEVCKVQVYYRSDKVVKVERCMATGYRAEVSPDQVFPTPLDAVRALYRRAAAAVEHAKAEVSAAEADEALVVSFMASMPDDEVTP